MGDTVHGTVMRVVDGDTFDVAVDGSTSLRVRPPGIDTQEVYGGVECWGRQGSVYAAERLLSHEVFLAVEPLQGDRDRYGRALRHVTLVEPPLDGVAEYALAAVESGNAYHDERYPVELAPELAAAENRARVAGRGLWGHPCYGRKQPVG